ncbi:hypothetical protein QBC37DRAFT_370984 [Rhypophila decipiens]|uniref:Uncharacterized protein n=1 Tax=Rhypophila decipiens TaxID=261697 RepID=A0AAN6YBX9_9PEZI|nr:hypothetical protein QBC37DRAFT_370984 [Rhypophila decipiens]
MLLGPKFPQPIVSAIQNAQTPSEGNGVEIVLHSNIVSGKELKRALDDMFPNPQEYYVQLRRDRYRITLPNHNKDDIQRYVTK